MSVAFSIRVYNVFTLRVIHTCYCYGSFSYVAKLLNLTRLILELMTELTPSQRN